MALWLYSLLVVLEVVVDEDTVREVLQQPAKGEAQRGETPVQDSCSRSDFN